MILVAAASLMLLTAEACARQGKSPELKIVDLQGDPILRIDATGSVFDDLDRKAAVINDREGTFTLLKDHQTIAFKNDPAVQRDNDRYIVKVGDGAIFDVKPDGAVLLNDKPWARVFGYTNADAQKNRFMAAIVIFPFLERDEVNVMLPRQLKNADRDPAIRRQPKISISSNDEVSVDRELIPKPDLDSQLGEKIDESLKRRSEANRIVNIASSIDVEWGRIVQVVNRVREKRVDRIGLIVENLVNRFLLQIPQQRDPNEDLSKLQPSPLPLGVVLSTDLQLKLIRGGSIDAYGHFPIGIEPYGKSEAKGGMLEDTSSLSQTLTRIFQERKEKHVYKPGMETRTDLPEDERIEKTVVIKAYRSCRYLEVIKLIDLVKGAGANPIILQLDDLP